MGALVFIAFVGGLVAFVAYFARGQDQRVNGVWARAAQTLGVEFKPPKWGECRRLEGKVLDCAFEVAEVAGGKGQTVRFAVTARGIPLDLSLEEEGGVAGLKRVLRGEDIRIRGGFFEKKDLEFGDGPFDELVKVAGPEDTARAALGSQARKAVFELMSKEPMVKLAQGSFVLEKHGPMERFSELEPKVQAMVRAAVQLRVTEVPEALVRNVREDAVAGARLRDLEVLERQYAGSPSALEAAQTALGDSDPEVRLAAARILGGDQERAAVDGLLGKLADLPTEIRVAALQRFAEIAEYEQVRRHVAQMLQSHEPKDLRAAMVAAAQGRDESAVARVCELTGSTHAEVASAAARALGEIGDPRGQAPLLRMLSHEDSDVRHAAVLALGKVGDIQAVEPLLPLANTVLPGALRDAAREAVRRIQSRLGEADAGRLSVARVDEDATAGLSVVESAGEPLKQKG
ncbi:MAG TPA: HEAT repeat domain-containing protein [Myxococcales bacterium]